MLCTCKHDRSCYVVEKTVTVRKSTVFIHSDDTIAHASSIVCCMTWV